MKTGKLRTVFFGTPQFVIPVLEAITKKDWLVGVVTAPDKKVGRKQVLTPSPIKSYLMGRILKGQAFQAPERLDEQVARRLKQLKPDLFVLAAYGRLLPQFILDIPKYGALNIHPSLLPKYRGPSPIQNAILNGDKTSGVTIIKMDKEMDHGPVIITKEMSLSENDTFDTLSTKLFGAGVDLLIKIIQDFVAGKVKFTSQNEKQATFTHLIKKEDGYFDIKSPPSPDKLDRMVRAYYPWPNAWTKWQGKIIKFLPSGLIQMEGKKPVTLEDFLHGYPDFPNFFRQ